MKRIIKQHSNKVLLLSGGIAAFLLIVFCFFPFHARAEATLTKPGGIAIQNYDDHLRITVTRGKIKKNTNLMYRIYKKVGDTYSLLNEVAVDWNNATYNLNDKAVTNGKSYTYYVRFYDKKTKAYSALISATQKKIAMVSMTLNYTNAQNGLTVSWNAVANATSYKVMYKQNGASEWIDANTKVTGTSYTITGLASGRKYDLFVKAKNSSGIFIGQSNQPTVLRMACPAIISVNESAKNKVKITWTGIAGAQGYNVYWAFGGTNSYVLAQAVTSGATTSCVISGAAYDKTYRYKVVAYSGNILSSESVLEKKFTHTWVEDEREDATCEEPGYVFYVCKVCEEEKEQELPALGHDWDMAHGTMVIGEPDDFPDDEDDEDMEEDDEDYDDDDLEDDPICLLPRYMIYHCKHAGCDAIKYSDPMPAPGHTVVIDKAVRATTKKTGLTAGSHCSVCGMLLKEQEVVPCKPAIKSISNQNNGIRLVWKDAKEAEEYVIYRKEGSKKWKIRATVDDAVYLDKKTTSGKKYTYKIVSVTEGDTKLISSPASSAVSICRVAMPSFKANQSIQGTMLLKWKKQKSVDGYQIVIKKGKKKVRTLNVKSGQSQTTVTNLGNGKYTCVIRSYKKTGGKNYYSAWNSKKCTLK